MSQLKDLSLIILLTLRGLLISSLSLSLFCSGEECERNTSSLQSHEGRSRGATQITTTPLSSPQFQKLKIIQVWCGVVWCGVVRGGDSD